MRKLHIYGDAVVQQLGSRARQGFVSRPEACASSENQGVRL